MFPSSVVPRASYNGGVDRALNLLLYPSNLASPGRLVKIARSLAPLFSQTHIVGIDQGGLPADEAVAPTILLTRVRGASLGASLGGARVVAAWGARVYRRFAGQRVAAVSAQNLFLLPLAHALARRTGAVFAYNAHELETETVGSAGLRQRLQRVIERRYIHRADVVSVVNESIAQWYRKAYPGVDPVVVTNAPTGADGVIDLRARLGVPEESLLYLHSGYLAPGRSIPLILRAFAQVSRAHVVFVGSGALLPEVERAAATYPNIHHLPPVEPDRVLALTRGTDVALCLIESGCLSHRMSTPNKMMEAFAVGVPALCSPRPADTWASRPTRGCWRIPSATLRAPWNASRGNTSRLSPLPRFPRGRKGQRACARPTSGLSLTSEPPAASMPLSGYRRDHRTPAALPHSCRVQFASESILASVVSARRRPGHDEQAHQ